MKKTKFYCFRTVDLEEKLASLDLAPGERVVSTSLTQNVCLVVTECDELKNGSPVKNLLLEEQGAKK